MQMHSASETKAVFVGSQRPPPQSPSSFLWIRTLTFPNVIRPQITLSLLLLLKVPISLPVFPLPACSFIPLRVTADGRLQLQSGANEDIQLGRTQKREFVAVEHLAEHLKDYFVPLNGASDGTSLIILNITPVWSVPSETSTQHTLQMHCLTFKSNTLLLCLTVSSCLISQYWVVKIEIKTIIFL